MGQPTLIGDYYVQRLTAGLSDHGKEEIARCRDWRRRDPGRNVRSAGSCACPPRERGGDVLPPFDLVGAVVARCSDNATRLAEASISLFPAKSTPTNCPELSRRFCTARATQGKQGSTASNCTARTVVRSAVLVAETFRPMAIRPLTSTGFDKTRANAVTAAATPISSVRRALHANPDLAPQRCTIQRGRA
jgi:hypothetical protein